MAIALVWPVAAGAQIVPIGPPTLLGQYGVGAVAADAQGRFFVMWNRRDLHLGVVRAFDAEGEGVRTLVLADPDPDREILLGGMAANADGSFLLVWTSRNLYRSRNAAFARFYGPQGVAQTEPIRFLAEATGVMHAFGNAARNRWGDAVVGLVTHVIHSGFSFRVRRFNARNAPVGNALTVRAIPEGQGVYPPRVAIDDGGRFVVLWSERPPDGGSRKLLFQRYRRDGTRRGRPRLVTRGVPPSPARVAMEPGGEFVVVWQRNQDIMARWFDQFGRSLSAEITVNDPYEITGESSYLPAVVSDPFGNAIILWTTRIEDPVEGSRSVVRGRIFDRWGDPLGDVFDVGEGSTPYVDVDDHGTLVVVWTTWTAAGRPRTAIQRFMLTCVPGYEERCSE